MRQRILAAGLAAGTALGTSNVAAAATPASFGASALSKLSALSWPAKLGVAAALAAPVSALPLVYAPVRGAALVSQVRSSAASVRAGAATKAALSRANSRPPEQAQGAPDTQSTAIAQVAPTTQTGRTPEPTQANVAARLSVPTVNNPAAAPNLNPNPNPASNLPSNVGEGEPAVAAFDSLSHGASVTESDRLRNESTLAAETQLLDRAFAALAAGDRGTASLLVAEHARLFPNGLLRQERERARRRLAQTPKGE